MAPPAPSVGKAHEREMGLILDLFSELQKASSWAWHAAETGLVGGLSPATPTPASVSEG